MNGVEDRLETSELVLGLLEWQFERISTAELRSKVEVFFGERLSEQAEQLASESINDLEFEQLVLAMLKSRQHRSSSPSSSSPSSSSPSSSSPSSSSPSSLSPSSLTPSSSTPSSSTPKTTGESLRERWAGSIEFEESEAPEVDFHERASDFDWLSLFYRADDWVCGITGGMLSIVRLAVLFCTIGVACLPLLLRSSPPDAVGLVQLPGDFVPPAPESVSVSSASESDSVPPAPESLPTPEIVLSTMMEEGDQPAWSAAERLGGAAGADVKQQVREPFDSRELDAKIDLIEQRAFSNAIDQLTALAETFGALSESPSILQLVLAEARLQQGTAASRDLVWPALIGQDDVDTKLLYHLLTAGYLLESTAEEREKILTSLHSSETPFAQRAMLWARVRNGDTSAKTLDELRERVAENPDDFADTLGEVMFLANAHYAQGDRARALQELLYVRKRLESLKMPTMGGPEAWLFEAATRRVFSKLDPTIAKLDAMAKESAKTTSTR